MLTYGMLAPWVDPPFVLEMVFLQINFVLGLLWVSESHRLSQFLTHLKDLTSGLKGLVTDSNGSIMSIG